MQDFDAVEFADRLAAMTDEEVFGLMERLEEASESIRPEDRDDSDVFAQIAMVETAIEDRFPGQLMAPYKDWQQRRVGG
ncbi:hypothetical protein [Agrobacterium tumefaciens]|uniref:hypothetical protein n=1 Tax=Agrobacterium tumefaciens TaxID=358 RepID=UPI00129B24BB|nr:hypothetical protein [Agrobacterium tumefaciens]MRH97992.1 hypothetical protein [Agrobacterium tumefaciens]